jgi:predicted kinase
VLIGGPPGTGKSTVADELGRRLGWTVVRSDEVRKEAPGLRPTDAAVAAYGEGLYAPAVTDTTYAELLRRADVATSRGESVVLDASWSAAAQRARGHCLARATRSELVELCCRCPAELATTRLTDRLAHRTDASDATVDVADRIRTDFAAWPGAHLSTRQERWRRRRSTRSAGWVRRAGAIPTSRPRQTENAPARAPSVGRAGHSISAVAVSRVAGPTSLRQLLDAVMAIGSISISRPRSGASARLLPRSSTPATRHSASSIRSAPSWPSSSPSASMARRIAPSGAPQGPRHPWSADPRPAAPPAPRPAGTLGQLRLPAQPPRDAVLPRRAGDRAGRGVRQPIADRRTVGRGVHRHRRGAHRRSRRRRRRGHRECTPARLSS